MSVLLQIAQALLFMHLEAVCTKRESYPTARRAGQKPIPNVQHQKQQPATLRSAGQIVARPSDEATSSSHAPTSSARHAIGDGRAPEDDMLITLSGSVFMGW